MKLPVVTLVFGAVMFACSPVALADEGDVVFDGKSLDGWKTKGCVAEIQDGAMLIASGNGLIYPDRQFGDFVIELQWKALKDQKWDSGIYFRCELPKGKRPWPSRWQANLRQGMEGNVSGLKGATSKGLVKDRQWNHFKLTVVGGKAALEINGKPAWKADGVTDEAGYVCLQAEVPSGGQFLFRNIRITPVKK